VPNSKNVLKGQAILAQGFGMSSVKRQHLGFKVGYENCPRGSFDKEIFIFRTKEMIAVFCKYFGSIPSERRFSP